MYISNGPYLKSLGQRFTYIGSGSPAFGDPGGDQDTQIAVVLGRHVARISPRRGPTWRGPKVPPTKNRKLLGFGPLFFGEPENFIFVFFLRYFFYFSISVRRGGGTFHPPSLLGVLIPGKSTTV